MGKPIFILFSLIIISCSNHRVSPIKTINDTLFFPNSLSTISDSSLIQSPIGNIIDTSAKTRVTVVWGDCHVCMKKINQWATFIEEYNLQDFQTLVIVTTTSPQYFIRIFKPELLYKGALVIDTENSFNKLNGLSYINFGYNTFLIYSNRKIVLIGVLLYFLN
ncbi:MAG: hypothetical protein AB7S48_06755 [Bacteroidales bacterium]